MVIAARTIARIPLRDIIMISPQYWRNQQGDRLPSEKLVDVQPQLRIRHV
jgi:hypothetical protein